MALLVIGDRLFEFFLAEVTGGSLVDRIRAPLGLLVAAALASATTLLSGGRTGPAGGGGGRPEAHDRARDPGGWHRPGATSAAPSKSCTGAGVTLWSRATSGVPALAATSAGGEPVPAAGGGAPHGPSADRLAEALAGVSAKRVLVITGPDDGVDVIPLRG